LGDKKYEESNTVGCDIYGTSISEEITKPLSEVFVKKRALFEPEGRVCAL
jgi:hypothetical protein